MTRKHFEAIADALRTARPEAPKKDGVDHGHANRSQWEADVVCVTTAISGFNPNFDRDRFFKACGLDWDGHGER